jgi:NAD(P) transhydrogenase subunit alpha
VVVATINVVGGFMVTDRMLQMFARKKSGTPSDVDAAKAATSSNGTA